MAGMSKRSRSVAVHRSLCMRMNKATAVFSRHYHATTRTRPVNLLRRCRRCRRKSVNLTIQRTNPQLIPAASVCRNLKWFSRSQGRGNMLTIQHKPLDCCDGGAAAVSSKSSFSRPISLRERWWRLGAKRSSGGSRLLPKLEGVVRLKTP